LTQPANGSDSVARPSNGTDPVEALGRFRLTVYKYFRYRGLGVDEANDLSSAVFERALVKFRSYDPARAALNTWVMAIARNMLKSHWRARVSRRAMPLETAEQQPGVDPPPEEVVIGRERREELIRALASLGERERDVIALKFAALITNREISRLTGLTESNVGVILFRSLRKLRAFLSSSRQGGR